MAQYFHYLKLKVFKKINKNSKINKTEKNEKNQHQSLKTTYGTTSSFGPKADSFKFL